MNESQPCTCGYGLYYVLRAEGIPAGEALRRARLAPPFPAEGIEPLEGADELLEHVEDDAREVARLRGLEEQLKYMTAKWTARGEDVDYLASELREAKYALREIAAIAARVLAQLEDT